MASRPDISSDPLAANAPEVDLLNRPSEVSASGLEAYRASPESFAQHNKGVNVYTSSNRPDSDAHDDFRDSRLSLASRTTRNSAASVFTTPRFSTASTALTRNSTRQSSTDLEALLSSGAWGTEKRKDSLDPAQQYFCTFCDESFESIVEWKTHQLGQHANDTSSAGRAWGCGFCAATLHAQDQYLDHVSAHFEDGKERSQWQYSMVIRALLQRAELVDAWVALVHEQELARGTTLRFTWNSRGLGQESASLNLQERLEYFSAGIDDPKAVAELAYRMAQVRTGENVSGLYVTNGHSSKIQSSTEAPPSQATRLPEFTDTAAVTSTRNAVNTAQHELLPQSATTSNRSPLPAQAGFSSQLAGRRASSVEPRSRVVANIAENSLGLPKSSSHFGPLRRVESSRNLSGSTSGAKPAPIDNPGIAHRASEDSEWLTTSSPTTNRSNRSHSGSSLVSIHTAGNSDDLDGSNSDLPSDDSFSEPDSWLDLQDISESSRLWARTLHQMTERVMDRVWVQYNIDWDTVIHSCVGDRGSASTSNRAHCRGTSGQTRKPAASQYGRGLRPNSRRPTDGDEEDDQDDGRRPSSSQSKRSSTSSKRFACPFRKHNPRVYNLEDHEVCFARSWDSVSRMKEHLYRKHCKVHCPRCKQTFRKASELEAHEMQPQGCEVRNISNPADITAAQEKHLRSKRYTTRYQTEEEKWREVYRLLFPDEEVPSPYPELTADMRQASSETQNNLQFQHFLLTTMPQLFRQTAEEHARMHTGGRGDLGLDLDAVITDALTKAFREWEVTSGRTIPPQSSPANLFPGPSITPPTMSVNTPEMDSSFTSQQMMFEELPVQPTHGQYWPQDEHMNTFPGGVSMSGAIPSQQPNAGFAVENSFAPAQPPYPYRGYQPGYGMEGGLGSQPWV